MPKVVLGLDPGSKCGFSVFKGKRRLTSGVWFLEEYGTKRPEKYAGLRDAISDIIEEYGVDLVAYEDVPPMVHRGKHACRLYNGLVAVIEWVAMDYDVPVKPLAISTVKKCLTGNGRAKKAEMIKFAKKKWKSAKMVTDDEADALGVGFTAVTQG